MIGGGEQYYRCNASEHGIEESDPQVPWKPLGITKKNGEYSRESSDVSM